MYNNTLESLVKYKNYPSNVDINQNLTRILNLYVFKCLKIIDVKRVKTQCILRFSIFFQIRPKDLLNWFRLSVAVNSQSATSGGSSGGGSGSPKTGTGNTASASLGLLQAIPSDAVKRLAFLFLSTCALLAFRLKIMGSKLPVFTRLVLPVDHNFLRTRQNSIRECLFAIPI